jgi:hypothetical protein
MIAEIAAESESEFDVVRAEMGGAIRQARIRALDDEMQALVASNLRTERAQSLSRADAAQGMAQAPDRRCSRSRLRTAFPGKTGGLEGIGRKGLREVLQ